MSTEISDLSKIKNQLQTQLHQDLQALSEAQKKEPKEDWLVKFFEDRIHALNEQIGECETQLNNLWIEPLQTNTKIFEDVDELLKSRRLNRQNECKAILSELETLENLIPNLQENHFETLTDNTDTLNPLEKSKNNPILDTFIKEIQEIGTKFKKLAKDNNILPEKEFNGVIDNISTLLHLPSSIKPLTSEKSKILTPYNHITNLILEINSLKLKIKNIQLELENEDDFSDNESVNSAYHDGPDSLVHFDHDLITENPKNQIQTLLQNTCFFSTVLNSLVNGYLDQFKKLNSLKEMGSLIDSLIKDLEKTENSYFLEENDLKNIQYLKECLLNEFSLLGIEGTVEATILDFPDTQNPLVLEREYSNELDKKALRQLLLTDLSFDSESEEADQKENTPSPTLIRGATSLDTKKNEDRAALTAGTKTFIQEEETAKIKKSVLLAAGGTTLATAAFATLYHYKDQLASKLSSSIPSLSSLNPSEALQHTAASVCNVAKTKFPFIAAYCSPQTVIFAASFLTGLGIVYKMNQKSQATS